MHRVDLEFCNFKNMEPPVKHFLSAHVDSKTQLERSVHFELSAPNAKKLLFNLEGADSVPMERGLNGTWTYETSPLRPDIYGYSFDVDGTSLLDPHNSSIKPNLIWQSNMFLVPGSPPEPWETQDVPHGSVTEHFYKSKVIGDQRNYFVYTPPGYDVRQRQNYPVLYLLHGYSDIASGWTAVGKANVILDNLIAAKMAKPMLVVMTLGYGVPDFAKPGGPAFRDPKLTTKNFDLFREALLTEVIPEVESQYRVSKDRKSRAIAGLSMGGAETLYVGLNNLDRFGYVGAFSTGGLGTDFDTHFPGLTARAVNGSLRELTVSCGTDDGLIGFNRELVGWLEAKKIKVRSIETPGRHTWMVWRRDLIDFAQKLFQ